VLEQLSVNLKSKVKRKAEEVATQALASSLKRAPGDLLAFRSDLVVIALLLAAIFESKDAFSRLVKDGFVETNYNTTVHDQSVTFCLSSGIGLPWVFWV
jgi:hypothetical protein